MDHAEDMCECLRQFLQSQAAEFNSMIRAVGSVSIGGPAPAGD